MPKFIVIVYERWKVSYEIEADSAKHARDRALYEEALEPMSESEPLGLEAVEVYVEGEPYPVLNEEDPE